MNQMAVGPVEEVPPAEGEEVTVGAIVEEEEKKEEEEGQKEEGKVEE